MSHPCLPEPLPLVPGPRLGPFTPTAHAAIEFIEELGNPGQDKDGRVWKVRIDGKPREYALKMVSRSRGRPARRKSPSTCIDNYTHLRSFFSNYQFDFNPTKFLREGISPGLVGRLALPQLYTDYFDPFSCECRAYGRLKQEGREDLAVRAHGYLLLTPQQEAEIDRRASNAKYPSVDYRTTLDGQNMWSRCEEHRDLPVRAIVKTLVSPEDPFTTDHVSQMWQDLEDLHRLGILVRDITVFNYIGGKLVDFSRALTTPHPFPGAMSRSTVDRLLGREPDRLHAAFVDWGMSRDWDWDVIPEDMLKCVMGEGDADTQGGPYGADPRQYDWRKWEKDPAAETA